MRILEVSALTKRYGTARGVEDVTFAIEPGEVFGYLGPNGSGKTTTIRCVMGLIAPTRGEARVLGLRVVPGKARSHARIGYLPGEFRIWKHGRARRSLDVLAGMGSPDRAKSRREELAERLNLDLGRRIGALSKGNRQKIGVIYAFQHRPELLILDEPTSGLDPLMRQVVLELILEAAEAGAAVLLSSHDLREVAAVCGRAAILREGRLVEVAPISSIVRQEEHRLKVWFREPTPSPKAPLDSLPGVRVVEQTSGMIHVAYRGAPEALLGWLARFPIDRIATPETSLEEAFIQYYNTAGKSPPDPEIVAGTDRKPNLDS